jgi:hypothetical protein
VIRRRPPRLVIELELERHQCVVMVLADSHEDELRLRSWLRRTPAFEDLPAFIAGLLDELDRIDEERAA